MKEMQFTAVVLMVMMAALLTWRMPEKVSDDRVTNRSRWLMTAALSLLGVQFAIQYIYGLRAMGVTQAVALNLTMFMPTSILLTMSILNLQRQGRIRPAEWAWSGVFYAVAMAILAVGCLVSGFDGLWLAEVAASVVYGAMQLWFTVLISRELRRMRSVLADYYDREPDSLIDWMQTSIILLLVMAITVPFFIFLSGWPLAAYGLFFFGAIANLWFSFIRHVIGSAAVRVKEAVESESKEQGAKDKLATPGDQRISQAVARWTAAGGHLQHNLKSADVAREMQIPCSHLVAWVKAEGYESFSQWMTMLRIDEAKRMLADHPAYTIEYIADSCGFSRNHFHTVFKRLVGVSPSEYQRVNEE